MAPTPPISGGWSIRVAAPFKLTRSPARRRRFRAVANGLRFVAPFKFGVASRRATDFPGRPKTSAERPVPRRARQLELPRTCTWGGARRGAGRRPPEYRAPVQHRRRIEHRAAFPVHITLRARADLTFATPAEDLHGVRRALTASSNARFRVLHFSVQDDHLHLIVEANDTQCAGSRCCGAQDPSGARDQSCACTSRSCLGGPLSRPLPAHAARGQSRPGLRPPELEKAPPEYAGPRRAARRRPGSMGGRSGPFHLVGPVRSRRHEHGSRRSAGVDAPQVPCAKTRRQCRTRRVSRRLN